ncbi:ABC transporter permease [Nitriliruptoraceae bacterium ZYF776]|nr:ABC transporter permease [Profundirhabdus halotolerans]
MDLLQELVTWFGADGRWSWTDGGGVPYRTVQHLWVSGVAVAIAVAVAVPPAMWLAHRRRAEALASAVVNLGRAVPSFGLIILFWYVGSQVAWIGTSFWPLVLALVALALPPIFTNTYTAIRGVDPATVEAARGVGLDERQILLATELPLASPVVLAGIRVATVQVIATTAIGAIVTNGGGLGRFIVDGFARGRSGYGAVLGGAIAVALLTLAVDQLVALAERRLVPRRVRGDSAPARVADQAGAAA